MKKHNLFKVVMIVLLVLVLVSWFLPVYNISNTGTEFESGDNIRVGFFALISFIAIALQYFSHIAMYILAIGALYGVLYKVPVYRKLLDKIVSGFKGYELLFMGIVMAIVTVLTSMVGLSLPILAFFPLIISVILMMGYDKVTAAMVTVGSVSAGMIGTVFSANAVSGISTLLEVPANTEVLSKIILLLVSFAIVFLNVFLYSRKHRKKEVVVEAYLVPEETTTKKPVWPLVVILDVVLIVLGLAFFSWELFNVTFFKDITNSLISADGGNITKGFLTALNALLGVSSDVEFGKWTLIEGTALLILASGLIGFVYRQKFDEWLKNMAEGAKKALKPALLVILIYAVLVFTTNVPIYYTLTNWFMSLNGELHVFIMMIVAIIFIILGVDAYYGLRAGQGYLASILAVDASKNVIIALIWQAMYGFTMLISPTSVVLMVSLGYLNLSYGKWMKSIWPLILELLAASTILLYIFAR